MAVMHSTWIEYPFDFFPSLLILNMGDCTIGSYASHTIITANPRHGCQLDCNFVGINGNKIYPAAHLVSFTGLVAYWYWLQERIFCS